MENSGLDDVDLSPKTRVWSWASEGRKRESRKETGESIGVELGGWEGQVACCWAEAIKVPFFSVPEEQAPNTQPLGQARSRVSP